MKNNSIENLSNHILSLGADNVGIVDVSEIVFSTEFRKICESNSCGMYNKNWTCPPAVGNIDDLINKAKSYTYAVVYQTISNIEDSFDIEGMLAAGQRLNKLSISISKDLPSYSFKDVLHLNAGGCKICKQCAKVINKPCIHPDLALASLESYGISVYDLAKSCNLKYTNGTNTVTYFGTVLLNL